MYDNAGQLLRENNQAANKTWVWTYDDAGNIVSKKEYAYTTGTLGTATSTVSYAYGNSTWGDLLTSYNGKTFSYDTIGNLLSDGTWTYTWEHGRELATMTSGLTTWTYTYDANGMRTQRTTGAATYTYVYNGSQLSKMTYGSNALYFTYDASGTPATVTYDGTTYYYALNLQGDVVAILDSAGTAVVEYTYDAWGKPLTMTGTMLNPLGYLNPLRYRGYVYDQETGFYYLQSRYYNPEIGRFLNADGLISTGTGLLGNNMFAYCNNSPILHKDDMGYSLKPTTTYINDGGHIDPSKPVIIAEEGTEDVLDWYDWGDSSNYTYSGVFKVQSIHASYDGRYDFKKGSSVTTDSSIAGIFLSLLGCFFSDGVAIGIGITSAVVTASSWGYSTTLPPDGTYDLYTVSVQWQDAHSWGNGYHYVDTYVTSYSIIYVNAFDDPSTHYWYVVSVDLKDV